MGAATALSSASTWRGAGPGGPAVPCSCRPSDAAVHATPVRHSTSTARSCAAWRLARRRRAVGVCCAGGLVGVGPPPGACACRFAIPCITDGLLSLPQRAGRSQALNANFAKWHGLRRFGALGSRKVSRVFRRQRCERSLRVGSDCDAPKVKREYAHRTRFGEPLNRVLLKHRARRWRCCHVASSFAVSSCSNAHDPPNRGQRHSR